LSLRKFQLGSWKKSQVNLHPGYSNEARNDAERDVVLDKQACPLLNAVALLFFAMRRLTFGIIDVL
jgi:hypothetical protein